MGKNINLVFENLAVKILDKINNNEIDFSNEVKTIK